jgi:uncharacterized protein with PQ loop repeat
MSTLEVLLGLFIIIGTFVTYSFQYKKLYDKKNTTGINDNMLLLGCLSSCLNLIGGISGNMKLININASNIFSLPIIQLFSPWICLQINYLIYYLYDNNQKNKLKFKMFNLMIFIILFIVYPIMITNCNNNYLIIANILNAFASIFSILMWVPQIITTYRSKTPGSLSLISVGCHSIGCLMVIIFQLIEKQLFSVTIPYIVALLCEAWIVIYCYLHRHYHPLLDIQTDMDEIIQYDELENNNLQEKETEIEDEIYVDSLYN